MHAWFANFHSSVNTSVVDEDNFTNPPPLLIEPDCLKRQKLQSERYYFITLQYYLTILHQISSMHFIRDCYLIMNSGKITGIPKLSNCTGPTFPLVSVITRDPLMYSLYFSPSKYGKFKILNAFVIF